MIPLAFVGLALFLRSRLGVAMRACADDADRAALVGIPVRRVHSVVWMLAALLAFLAVFLRAGIVGLSHRDRARPVAAAAGARGRGHRAHGAAPDDRVRRHRARHRRAGGGLGLERAQRRRAGALRRRAGRGVVDAARRRAARPASSRRRGEPSASRARCPASWRGLPEVRVAGVALVGAVVLALALVPVVFSREPHQPRRGRARLRRDRAVARRADRLGGRDQPRARWRSSRSAPRSVPRSPPGSGGTSRFGLLGARAGRRRGGDAHRAPRAAPARAHARRGHARVRVGDHRVAAEPPHLRRRDPLRLAAAAARRTRRPVRDHRRAVGGALLLALPRARSRSW